MKIIYQEKGRRSVIQGRHKNAIQQIMSSGCGRGSEKNPAKRKRDLAHLAKLQGPPHSNQMTPEFGSKATTHRKLLRQKSHEDPYPSKNEHSISDHSAREEIQLAASRNSMKKWFRMDSPSPRSNSRHSQPISSSAKSRNSSKKKVRPGPFDPSIQGTPTLSPTTRDHTDLVEPLSSLIGLHSPVRSPRSQLSIRPFSRCAEEDIRSHGNSPRFLRKKSENSLLYDEEIRMIPSKRKKYQKPEYEQSRIVIVETTSRIPNEANEIKPSPRQLLDGCPSSQKISLVCEEDILEESNIQSESLHEHTSDISVADFQLPSQSHAPSQSLPLTISNVTFHNFFSDWEKLNHSDELTIRQDCLTRLQMQHIKPQHRSTLVNWLFCLSNSVPFSRETVHHSISIIDLFLSNCQGVVLLTQLQLVGISSLALSVKLNQIQCPTMSQLSQATCCYYSTNQIIEMEGIIASTLQFRLSSVPVLATSLNQLMTEWDAFISINFSEYPLLSALITPCLPIFGIMPNQQRRFMQAQNQQSVLSSALFWKAYVMAESILFSLNSYQYTNTALSASVLYYTFQDLFGFSNPISKQTEQELNDMFNCFTQTVLNVEFPHLAPTLDFVSHRLHVPIFKPCKCVRPSTVQNYLLDKKGHVPNNGVHIQKIFNLYDFVLQEHRFLEDTYGYDFNEIDRELVMRSETNLQLLIKEWRQWKGVKESEGPRPLAVKWESVYVAQSYYEELKERMVGTASPSH